MKNMRRRLVLLVCVVLMLVSVLTGCGKNEDETLSIKVEQMERTEEGLELLFTTQNDTGYDVSLGWTGSCDIEVTTTEKTYYYKPFMDEIPRGESQMAYTIPNVEGEVEKVVITELCLLNISGCLPGKKIRNAVVFDTDKELEGFVDSFGGFGLPFDLPSDITFDLFDLIHFTATGFMFVFAILLMLATIIFYIIWAIHTHKQNKKSVQKFNPFGSSSGTDFSQAQESARQMHETAHQMHMNAHKMHMDAHQSIINQNAVDFTQAASMPMDMGGILPPTGF